MHILNWEKQKRYKCFSISITMNEIKIDIAEFENIINKLKMYKKEENLNFENIKNIFDNLDSAYNTNNKDKIEIIKSELILNCSNIEKIHNENIYFLDKKLNTYREKFDEGKRILDNIDKI